MIHGNQYLLPLYMRKNLHQPPIGEKDELTLAFYLLTKDLGKNERIISFSRLLWPFLSIQGVVSTHIILDGLLVFNKVGRFSNPPRQPLIGHILRNVKNRTQFEELNKIIEILTYKDKEAQEIGEGEESEYQALVVSGLINPEILHGLAKLIPLIEYKPISEFTVLDTSITTENALNIAERYRNIIQTIKGNALRWKTQIELIGKEIDKWLIEINVQLKDVALRYSSQINKTSSSIDTSQADDQINLEQDKIDQWNISEKKKVIENISTLFKTLELQLEEIIKKNRFFSRDETLKSRVFEDLMPYVENHFSYLKEEGHKFLEALESLYQRHIELKNRTVQIDKEAKQKLDQIRGTLDQKLMERNKLLSEFQDEKIANLSKLEEFKDKIEALFNNVKEIVQIKHNHCLQEAQNLVNWSLTDDQSELFSRPIQWIYLPIYAMFIENAGKMEEYMNLVFPGYITNNPNNLYEVASEVFNDLKNILNKKLEEDMALRSNFEFSCERKNLIKDPNFKKMIQMGTSTLRNKMFINDLIESNIREKLNSIP